ncbi:oligopeptide/dipeptide ABC transporter ATP-binding protein [Paraburkholderia sp.]|uniref:ABC transporter ATP-binding protein n=1 Tax=Paraburkholderia sp. TaxID=1926495 RepID=UPI002F411761
MALLSVEHLTKHIRIGRGIGAALRGNEASWIKPVEDVSFSIDEGEIVGIVGESGCGKSTTCNLLSKLDVPTSGTLRLNGDDVTAVSRGNALTQYRKQVQLIFQDPFDSLNPRLRVLDIVAEAPRALKLWDASETARRVMAMLELVGLPPERYAKRFPHQMSGGERQRVGIASALIAQPRLVIADEPVSMLDVSIRAGVMDLLRDLSTRLKFSCLYVSHDLSILTHLCDRVMVMYLGQLVEIASAAELVGAPRHPYTRALVAAVPVPDPRHKREPVSIEGELAKPIDPPPGCRFAPRCSLAMPQCTRTPEMKSVGGSHTVACHAVHADPCEAAGTLPPAPGRASQDMVRQSAADIALARTRYADPR